MEEVRIEGKRKSQIFVQKHTFIIGFLISKHMDLYLWVTITTFLQEPHFSSPCTSKSTLRDSQRSAMFPFE